MPRYWILCMVEENYLIAKREGLFGVTQRAKHVLERISVGDLVTFYISKKKADSPFNHPLHKVQQFRGVARVSSSAFESDDVIWPLRDNEIFPYRMRLQFLSDDKVEAKRVVTKLSFVRNEIYWALPLRKGYEEITEKDFEVIQQAMEPEGEKVVSS